MLPDTFWLWALKNAFKVGSVKFANSLSPPSTEMKVCTGSKSSLDFCPASLKPLLKWCWAKVNGVNNPAWTAQYVELLNYKLFPVCNSLIVCIIPVFLCLWQSFVLPVFWMLLAVFSTHCHCDCDFIIITNTKCSHSDYYEFSMQLIQYILKANTKDLFLNSIYIVNIITIMTSQMSIGNFAFTSICLAPIFMP